MHKYLTYFTGGPPYFDYVTFSAGADYAANYSIAKLGVFATLKNKFYGMNYHIKITVDLQ